MRSRSFAPLIAGPDEVGEGDALTLRRNVNAFDDGAFESVPDELDAVFVAIYRHLDHALDEQALIGLAEASRLIGDALGEKFGEELVEIGLRPAVRIS